MNKNEFYEKLNTSDLEVTFEKRTTGETRVMKCTANGPEDLNKVESKRKTNSDTLVTVFDTEVKDWRSFHLDSIKEIKPLNSNFGLLQE